MSSSHFITDGSIPSPVDRYLDGDLGPEERAALVAHLRADPAQRQAFVAELRLAAALGTALADVAAARAARADLLMATLSESRSTAALRHLEQAIGLDHARTDAWRWWLPWLPAACAAAVMAAIIWHTRSIAVQPPPARVAVIAPTPLDAPITPPVTNTPPPDRVPVADAHPTPPGPAVADAHPDAPPRATEPAPAPAVPPQSEPTPALAEQAPLATAVPAAGGPSSASPPRRVHTTTISRADGESPLRPPGAESWIGAPCIIHRHSKAIVVRIGSAALLPGDVIDTSESGTCEVRLGSECAITCALSTRVVVLAPRPTVPGRRLALVWGELAASPSEGTPALISTPHGDVRCEGGRTIVHAYPDWVSVAADGGHARVGSDSDRKSLDDGQYALLVHGRSVIAPTARSQSAILAGILTVHGEAQLPCILRLAGALPSAARAERLHALSDAGFTAISLGSSAIDVGVLGDAQSAGLGVIGEVGPDIMASQALQRCRAQPALLAWWMPGAPGDGLPRDAVRIASTVRRIDPLHVLAASFVGDQPRGTPPACDLLVLEHSADDTPMAMATRWSGTVAAAAVRAKTVLAAVPLMTPIHDQAIGPSTQVRQRCLAYLALVSGARGLVWSGRPSSANDADAWDEAVASAGALSTELLRVAPLVLHGARQRVPLAAALVPGMRWDGSGRAAIVLVNPTDRPLAITAALPGVALVDPHLLTDDGAGDVRLTGSHLSGILPPYGAAIILGDLPFTP
jgi:hypothetical protein